MTRNIFYNTKYKFLGCDTENFPSKLFIGIDAEKLGPDNFYIQGDIFHEYSYSYISTRKAGVAFIAKILIFKKILIHCPGRIPSNLRLSDSDPSGEEKRRPSNKAFKSPMKWRHGRNTRRKEGMN